MAGSVSEEYGVGRSSEGISSGQHCQSREALVEWRSCEQVENGTPSTSPPFWDTDDDDDCDDCGPKPSELYGKFTWKIENFSQISKRELRSNPFEVGGYKWYILVYPQGCDVNNHLSLFLCVANHDKLLPGWGHFAQFTIAVVNKDPKKSKYSDTLHRFWKKEHDWGWKKFMELSKVLDGFIVDDALVIKAQVQLIREKLHRPFRCLDCQYRRELVRVYLTNVEQICRRFVEEKRGKLGKLIEDKVRWSSFCAFWLGVDETARRRMSREKTDVILKVVVKQFFIEKEVASTLVMDSLYSGLKALECQSKSEKGRAKVLNIEETPAPVVRIEKDMFALADDILLLLERAALEPLPPKDDKGPQNRTKDVSSGEDFNKDSIERDERRLTELGRRTVEIFALAHIFSNKIEVAYQEAVSLKRQEELIREEEAAGPAESEQKARRGAAEKEKRTKKKQNKQRRSNRKGKDIGSDEKLDVAVQDEQQHKSATDERTMEDISVKQALSVLDKPDALEDVSDVSFTGDDVVVERLQPDLEDIDDSPVNWDTDTSEAQPPTEASSGGVSELLVQSGCTEKKSTSVIDDSSSTCSTDSVPSVVMNGPYKGNSWPNYRSQTSSSRGKNRRVEEKRDRTGWVLDMDNQQSEPVIDLGRVHDASGTCRAAGPEPEADVLCLKDRIQWLEQHLVEKEEEVVTLQRKLIVKDRVNVKRPSKQRMKAEASSSPSSPTRNLPSNLQRKPMAESISMAEPFPVKETSSNSPRQTERAVPPRISSPQIPSTTKLDAYKPATPSEPACTPVEKPTAHQVSVMSTPSSTHLLPGPKPTSPVVSMVQTAPLLARSASAAGQLGTELSSTTQSYAPQSYRNAIIGNTMGASLASFTLPPSSAISSSPARSQPPSALVSSPMLSSQSSARKDQSLVRSGFNFGSVTPEILQNKPQWVECSQQDASSIISDPSLLSGIQNFDLYGSRSRGSQMYFSGESPSAAVSEIVPARQAQAQAQAQAVSPEEFPHLDIINYLLDEEHNIGKAAAKANPVLSPNNGHHHPLNRQFLLPVDTSMPADMGPSINYCRFGCLESFNDRMHQVYGSFDRFRDAAPLVGLSGYANGQVDGVIQNRWPIGGVDLSSFSTRNDDDGYLYQLPDARFSSNLACGVNSYTLFQPSSGH